MEGIKFKLNQSFTHQNPCSDIMVWRANSAYPDLLGLCDLSAVTVVLSMREDFIHVYTLMTLEHLILKITLVIRVFYF